MNREMWAGVTQLRGHLRRYHNKNPEVPKLKQTCHMNGTEVLRREVRDEVEVRSQRAWHNHTEAFRPCSSQHDKRNLLWG